MKFDLNTTVKSIAGFPFKDESDQPITIKSIVLGNLLANTKEDSKEKLWRGELAYRIYDSDGDIELNLEDTAKLKNLIIKEATRPDVCVFVDRFFECKLELVKGV